MNPLLAIETATAHGSVALLVDGEVTEVELGEATTHAAAILPAIRDLLAHPGIRPANLRGVVVGGGPGSFTGVRVAAATARGLVRALGIPLLAYPSLAAAAVRAAKAGTAVCAMFDARRDEVYAACYRFRADGPWETLLPPEVAAIDAIVERLTPYRPVYVGDGVVKHRNILSDWILSDVRVGAEGLFRLVKMDAAAGSVANPAAWEPEYLRPPGAKRPR